MYGCPTMVQTFHEVSQLQPYLGVAGHNKRDAYLHVGAFRQMGFVCE